MSNILALEPGDVVVLTVGDALTSGQEERATLHLQGLIDGTGVPATAVVYHGGARLQVMRSASKIDADIAGALRLPACLRDFMEPGQSSP